MASLLKLGRAMGLENVSQLRGMVKTIRKGAANTAAAHLKLKPSDVDAFQKAATEASDLLPELSSKVRNYLELTRAYFPKSYANGAEHTLDVVARRFGNGSGAITLSSATKSAEGAVINQGRTKILGNKAGFRAIVNSNVENNGRTAIDAFVRPNVEMSQEAAMKIVKALNYNEANGVTQLAANVKDAGTFGNLNLNVQVPTGYMDAVTRVETGNSFGQLMGKLKGLING